MWSSMSPEAIAVAAELGGTDGGRMTAPLVGNDDPAHTGAMLALVPSVEDTQRLAADGGEPAEELHCTIAYLGKADQFDAAARQQLIAATTAAVQGMPVIDADAFGLAAFGQGGDEPCNVLNVGGVMLDAAHQFLTESVPFEAPGQHAPWNAHVTLEYSDDLGRLKQLVDRLGPIRFDRVRLAIGGDVVDIPLLDGEPDGGDDGYAAWLAGEGLTEADTHAGDGRLKQFWLGKGLSKWATSPHPWTALFRHLRKYIKNTTLLKKTVSRWYIDHFGHTPSQKLAEAATGPTVVTLVETGTFLELHPDDVTDAEPLSGEELALLTALDELDGADLTEVFDASQARYPKGSPLGGKFRPMADRIKQSIEDHRAGKHGDKHPLDGYNREQLRRVAKARGIDIERGEDRDSIAAKLLADHGPAPKVKATAKVTSPAPEQVKPTTPAVSPELAERIKAASASMPKTKEDWEALVPYRESTHDYYKGKLGEAKDEQAKVQAEHDALVAKFDDLLRRDGIRRKDSRQREMGKFVDYQRSLDRLEWAQASVDQYQHHVDNPGFHDFDTALSWPRDRDSGRVMPTDDHNRHLDTALDVGNAFIAEAQAAFDADPEIVAARKRRDRRKTAEREALILRQMLASARGFGGVQHTNISLDPGDGTTHSLGARADGPARIRAAERWFPDGWVDLSAKQNLNLTSTDRAYYSAKKNTLAMDSPAADNTWYDGGFSDYTDEINVHELGHRMEQMVPGLTALEFAMVRRRSTRPDGSLEPTRKLSETPGGAGFGDSEVTFEDEWANPYAGKTYEASSPDRPDTAAWEVFQVGLQDLFGRSFTTKFDAGPELQAFTAGALLTLA
jgi:hypothetical protein